MEQYKNIAVLIDADNTDINCISKILNEISIYGHISLKRAYGNWSKESLKGWEEQAKQEAIRMVQQYDFVKGKNASDIAMIIEAMKLLYSNRYDAFAIVSSDSDFTPLAIELREHGLFTIGVGKSTAIKSFINACDKFVTISEKKDENNNLLVKEKKQLEELHQQIKFAADNYKEEDGYCNICSIGSYIQRTNSEFKLKDYGHKSWTEFVDAYPDKYDVKRRKGSGGVQLVMVKCK
ncbi:NYN domain-containing protein [Treponema rectale]|uniref:NYN domain-containing protein n=1 Tax=Treponema rectale TaxID=744512 RepID=A0A7M1XIH6_9SPIR|nr:NYN domain-containing protein [Treponema rectale]